MGERIACSPSKVIAASIGSSCCMASFTRSSEGTYSSFFIYCTIHLHENQEKSHRSRCINRFDGIFSLIDLSSVSGINRNLFSTLFYILPENKPVLFLGRGRSHRLLSFLGKTVRLSSSAAIICSFSHIFRHATVLLRLPVTFVRNSHRFELPVRSAILESSASS